MKVLGSDSRRITAAFGEADGDGLTARQTAVVALGWDGSVPSRVEAAQGRWKRLVERLIAMVIDHRITA